MRKHQGAIMLGLAIAVIAIMLLSVSVGPVKISILEIAKMLLHKIGLYSNTSWLATNARDNCIPSQATESNHYGYPQEPIYAMIY